MTELADLSASELLSKFRTHEASPVEAVESCLARMRSLEPKVNAVLTLCADQCLEAAAASAKRWMSGDARMLEGVPFGLKDIIQTQGIRTTGGSRIYADYVPTETATVARRLMAEHGLLLAKLQTYEFAIGEDSHYGPTRNPWNLERTPGGSSSGGAAALAAREVTLAIGTDTGGSIRVPSTFCGINGFKPTQGLISRHGVMPLSWTLDHVGPMARSVEDLALMLTVIAGHDPRDPTSLGSPRIDYVEALGHRIEGTRIGVPVNWFFDIVDRQVEAATREAIEVLTSDGARLVEIELPHAYLADAIGFTIMHAEHASLHEDTFGRLEEYSAPMSQQVLATAQFISALDYLKALRTRYLIQRDFESAFDKVDAIIVPGMMSVAPRLHDMSFEIDGKTYSWAEGVARMTMIFNIAGLPALSVPSGLHESGLPMGIQIAARPLDERTCIRIGHAYQRATSHHTAVPPLSSQIAS